MIPLAAGPFRHRIDIDLAYVPLSVVALAMGGALCYALASVLQHQAATRQPPDLAMRAGLLFKLVQQPRWLLGNVADGAGYVFQFLALRRGSLALVGPLLVCGLIFALPVSAVLDHRRPSRREWLAGLVVVAGLVVFLSVARPGPGHPRASNAGWAVLTILTVVIVGGAMSTARGSQRRRAVCLGFGAGILYGYTSALTERTGHLLDRGVLHPLTSWSPYALVVSAVLGMLLTQSAFQAGDLRLSLPTLTVVEPLAAIAIGQVLFGEHIATHGLAPLWEGVGLAIMAVGVFTLARSPAVAPEEQTVTPAERTVAPRRRTR